VEKPEQSFLLILYLTLIYNLFLFSVTSLKFTHFICTLNIPSEQLAEPSVPPLLHRSAAASTPHHRQAGEQAVEVVSSSSTCCGTPLTLPSSCRTTLAASPTADYPLAIGTPLPMVSTAPSCRHRCPARASPAWIGPCGYVGQAGSWSLLTWPWQLAVSARARPLG
jgi:hypothetical protein